MRRLVETTPLRPAVVLLAAFAAVLGACAGDDARTDGASPSPAASTAPGRSDGDAAGATAGDDTSGPPAVAITVTVPESGVPGLDSADEFCAAWSRFGGSWQVIQVAANFAPDPSIVPAIEVVASPVVTDAYPALLDAWPAPLASEREVVARDYFGPFLDRARAARRALVQAGATDADLSAIAGAWVDALAARSPDDPTVSPQLDDARWALVDAAAAAFTADTPSFLDDPTMVITAETPLTDAHLATACPDQGALAGQDVVGDP